jgi:hypothetical protein
MWLVLVLVLATTSLALGILHRTIDAHFEEQVAVARVEKARVLARLRAETARAMAAAMNFAPPATAPSQPGRCGGGLRPVPGGSSCIAAYEYPAAHVRPRVGVTVEEARALCAQRGERLCRQEEWEHACRGEAGQPYPYGPRALRGRCNTTPRSETTHALGRAGQFPACRTAAGVYDLAGNAGEWVDEGVVMGGDAHVRPGRARCGAARALAPGLRSPLVGFRCCLDAQ